MGNAFKFSMFLAVLILTSCSAGNLAMRALKKDPTIFDIKADTIETVKIEYRPVKVFIHDTIQVNFTSDTAYIDTLIILNTININPITIVSNDGIAHAQIRIKNGRIISKIWAVIDTTFNWQDSVIIQQKEIHTLQQINKKAQITINEKSSLLKKLQYIIISIAVLFIILIIVRWMIKN